MAEIQENLENALRRSAELDASHITVRAEGGKVILGGKVHAWHQRDLADLRHGVLQGAAVLVP